MRAAGAALSVRRRLLGTCALLAALILVVGAAGVLGLALTADSARDARDVTRLERTNTALLQAMTDAETAVRGYRLSGDPEFLAPYDAGAGAVPALLSSGAAADDPDLRRLFLRQDELARRWLEDFGGRIARSGPGIDREPVATAAAKAAFDEFRAANAGTAARLEVLQSAADSRVTRVRIIAAGLTVSASLLCGVVAAVASVHVSTALVEPLSALRDTVADLTAGRHGARAPVIGPSEVRAVAESVNALADESDQLRFVQSESDRLRQLARDVGRQIRDHVDVDDLVAEAVAAVGVCFALDRVYVRMVDGDALTPVDQEWTRPSVGHAPGSGPPLSAESMSWAHQLYSAGAAYHCTDVRSEPFFDNDWGRSFVAATDAVSVLTLGFGDGAQLLGTMVLMTCAEPRQWSDHEVAAIMQITADLGRGIVHARHYGQQLRLVRQLRELDRTKTDFLSTISHELRTPLTSISGYVELIRDGEAGEVSAELDRMLGVVDRNAGRLTSLIEDLLTLSRVEAGTFKVTVSPVDVAALARGCIDTVRPAAGSAGLDLHVAVDEVGEVVDGDAAQLERALLNLLSNAVKFTPAGGRVSVVVRRDGGSDSLSGGGGDVVVVEVRDTGIGIPAAEQDRLFSRFFRATNATERAIQGTGLGLMIVRSIVERHHGTLELVSREDAGTAVRLSLPVRAVPVDGEGTAAADVAFSGRLS